MALHVAEIATPAKDATPSSPSVLENVAFLPGLAGCHLAFSRSLPGQVTLQWTTTTRRQRAFRSRRPIMSSGTSSAQHRDAPGPQMGLTGKTASTPSEYLTAELDHVALRCRGDALKLAHWYAEVLRFQPIDFEEFAAGSRPFPSVRISPSTIIDFFQASEDQAADTRNGDHICFALSSRAELESTVERFRKLGLLPQDTEPKPRSGARGNGHSVYISDPEDNTLEFRAYY